jgi:sugar phosphate isomerase/epimerase
MTPNGPRDSKESEIAYVRAFSTLGCPALGLGDACAAARAHGIPMIELRALGGSLDLPSYFAGRGDSPASISEAAAGVRIVALGTSLRLADGTAEDRRKFLEYVPWAEAIGVPRLRVFDGGAISDRSSADRAAEAAAWWRDLRAERGWRTDIMVETHESLLRAAEIRRFSDASPGTGILWDSHHTWRKGGEDPSQTWSAIGPHVVHIHVKDSVSGSAPGLPARYVLPGTGEFPMAALRSALAGNYGGPLSLEWERHWHPELAPIEEALRSAAAASWW